MNWSVATDQLERNGMLEENNKMVHEITKLVNEVKYNLSKEINNNNLICLIK